MKDWAEALRTSSALDDQRARERAPEGQARVDEALSNPFAAKWEAAPAGLRARVMEHVRSTRPRETPVLHGPVRYAALAAAATVLLTLSAGIYLAWPPAPVTPTDPIASTRSFDPGALVELPAQTEQLAIAMESPLVEEARLIREDTRRAFAGAFAQLPTRITR